MCQPTIPVVGFGCNARADSKVKVVSSSMACFPEAGIGIRNGRQLQNKIGQGCQHFQEGKQFRYIAWAGILLDGLDFFVSWLKSLL